MGAIGDTITQPIPVVGTSGTAYAQQVDDFLTEVKTRLESKISLSSFLVGLLDMANNAITNVEYLLLYPQTVTPSAPTNSLQSFNGDVWWVSPSGAVQITVGTSLNASAIGGITGDYGGSNPAQLRFVDANTEYYAYDDFSAGKWAYFQARAFDITGGSVGAPRVRLSWSGFGSYTLTLPASAPAAQAIAQIDASGNMTASNAMAANQDITISGTGNYKHGNFSTSQTFIGANATSGGSVSFGVTSNVLFALDTAGTTFYLPIYGLKVADKIQTVRISYGRAGTAPTISLIKNNLTVAGFGGSVITATTATANGGFPSIIETYTITVTTPAASTDGDEYILKFVGGSGAITYYGVTTTYSA